MNSTADAERSSADLVVHLRAWLACRISPNGTGWTIVLGDGSEVHWSPDRASSKLVASGIRLVVRDVLDELDAGTLSLDAVARERSIAEKTETGNLTSTHVHAGAADDSAAPAQTGGEPADEPPLRARLRELVLGWRRHGRGVANGVRLATERVDAAEKMGRAVGVREDRALLELDGLDARAWARAADELERELDESEARSRPAVAVDDAGRVLGRGRYFPAPEAHVVDHRFTAAEISALHARVTAEVNLHAATRAELATTRRNLESATAVHERATREWNAERTRLVADYEDAEGRAAHFASQLADARKLAAAASVEAGETIAKLEASAHERAEERARNRVATRDGVIGALLEALAPRYSARMTRVSEVLDPHERRAFDRACDMLGLEVRMVREAAEGPRAVEIVREQLERRRAALEAST